MDDTCYAKPFVSTGFCEISQINCWGCMHIKTLNHEYAYECTQTELVRIAVGPAMNGPHMTSKGGSESAQAL